LQKKCLSVGLAAVRRPWAALGPPQRRRRRVAREVVGPWKGVLGSFVFTRRLVGARMPRRVPSPDLILAEGARRTRPVTYREDVLEARALGRKSDVGGDGEWGGLYGGDGGARTRGSRYGGGQQAVFEGRGDGRVRRWVRREVDLAPANPKTGEVPQAAGVDRKLKLMRWVTAASETGVYDAAAEQEELIGRVNRYRVPTDAEIEALDKRDFL